MVPPLQGVSREVIETRCISPFIKHFVSTSVLVGDRGRLAPTTLFFLECLMCRVVARLE